MNVEKLQHQCHFFPLPDGTVQREYQSISVKTEVHLAPALFR